MLVSPSDLVDGDINADWLLCGRWPFGHFFRGGDHSGHALDFHCGRLRVPCGTMIYWIDMDGFKRQHSTGNYWDFSPQSIGAFHELALQAFLRMILVGLYISTILYISFNHLPTW